jgi:hypothetical protein
MAVFLAGQAQLETAMDPPISPVLFAVFLFIGMLILLEAGRRLAFRHPKESEGERAGLGAIEGAVFALFGLLMAFTFSGAALRFNEKRMLIANEANSIETAYLRLQLVPQEAQLTLEELFRQYVDSRLDTYHKLPNIKAAEPEMVRSQDLQREIWRQAVTATRLPNSHSDAGKLLLPALNNMIDITTTRTMALQSHPPRIIYVLLFGLGLICSLLAGYRMTSGQSRSWLHILGFSVITVIVVYVMLDIEYPRAGLIRLETAEQMLVKIRDGMR